MSVDISALRALAPELSQASDAILTDALAAVPLLVNLSSTGPFTATPAMVDRLTTYMALHIVSLMGFGRASTGRVASKSAGGVSITFAQAAEVALSDLSSTPWGVLYKLAVRPFGLRGAVT